MRHLATIFGVGLAAITCGACEDYAASADRLRARQQAIDPPHLWSIETLEPQRAGPVTICADTFLVQGFTRPLPNFAGKQCALAAQPHVSPGRVQMTCTLNGHIFKIDVGIRGDEARAFDIDYSLRGNSTVLRQVRRYQRLGACPAGWDIGDNTDQRGRLRKNALH